MRVLAVLRDPLLPESIAQRCGQLAAQGHQVAVCYVAPTQLGLRAVLEVQRKVTLALRRALDNLAEDIPIFVVTEREGDRVEDCARAWGATEVQV
ncbi:MAG: hypothetical protein ACOY0T_06615 [Myxococcota bacterium]